MKKKITIAITGGGTGGHLAIARTINEALVAQGITTIYIGSESGQDRSWFEEAGTFAARYFLPTKGVVNQKGFSKLASLLHIFKALMRCRGIFKEHEVQAVFSVGGFSAAPGSFAAVVSGRPLFIHEQNAVKGSLNRILSPLCRVFFSSYHAESPLRDYPVAERFFESYRERTEIKTVIFLGGSQGAVAINDLAMKVAQNLKERGIHIIHQAGKRDITRVRAFYSERNLDVDVFDFDPNLLEKITNADFAISRAGASTLWELAAAGVPAFFIPYPYAAGDHQYQNAKFLVDQNLAFVKRQEEVNESDLLECLDADVAHMSQGLKNAISPEGAKKMVGLILEQLNG